MLTRYRQLAVALAALLLVAAALVAPPYISYAQHQGGTGGSDQASDNDNHLVTAELTPTEGDVEAIFGFSPTVWTALATIFIAAFTCVLGVVAIWQIKLARRGIEQAERAADAALEAAKNYVEAERAYITMSHFAPGLKDADARHASLKVRIQNYGRSPAEITDVFIQLGKFGGDNPPPISPVYEGSYDNIGPNEKTGYFLVSQDHFSHIATMEWPPNDDPGDVWAFGYVDYIDKFKRRHRNGYARVYDPIPGDPSLATNNLVFPSIRGWNYDRPRVEGEGGDWNDEGE